jgi:hypothetical protein
MGICSFCFSCFEWNFSAIAAASVFAAAAAAISSHTPQHLPNLTSQVYDVTGA